MPVEENRQAQAPENVDDSFALLDDLLLQFSRNLNDFLGGGAEETVGGGSYLGVDGVDCPQDRPK